MKEGTQRDRRGQGNAEFDVDLPEDSRANYELDNDDFADHSRLESAVKKDPQPKPRVDSSPQRQPIGPQSGQKSQNGRRAQNDSGFGGGLDNHFDDGFDDETGWDSKDDPARANKQVPIPKSQDNSVAKLKPDFTGLKGAKPSGIKEDRLKSDINLQGRLKPNLSLDQRSFKTRPQNLDFRVNGANGMSSRPHLYLKSGNATSMNMKEPTLGRSIWDPRISKPRHEQILEQAHSYLEDNHRRTLDELFAHNNRGTTLLKEINELLNTMIERHKAELVSGKTMPSLQQSTKGADLDKQRMIFEKEIQSGQHLLRNLEMEMQEVDGIIESVRDPL